VSYQTTIGWSLISSGLVTLLLAYLPGDSVWYGVALLVLGIAVFFLRR
jgi:membrane protein required for beta-lactamase induction